MPIAKKTLFWNSTLRSQLYVYDKLRSKQLHFSLHFIVQLPNISTLFLIPLRKFVFIWPFHQSHWGLSGAVSSRTQRSDDVRCFDTFSLMKSFYRLCSFQYKRTESKQYKSSDAVPEHCFIDFGSTQLTFSYFDWKSFRLTTIKGLVSAYCPLFWSSSLES